MRTSRAFQSDVSKRMFGWRSAVVACRSAIAQCASTTCAPGLRSSSPARSRASGGTARPVWKSIGTPRSAASAKAASSAGCEKSKPGRLVWSLMPHAPASSAERQLGQEPLARLAAAERQDAPVARRGRGQHLGVGRRVARAGRRLERERAGAGDASGVHRREQPGEIEARAVGRVLAQVRVHVDERSGHQRPHVRAPDRARVRRRRLRVRLARRAIVAMPIGGLPVSICCQAELQSSPPTHE